MNQKCFLAKSTHTHTHTPILSVMVEIIRKNNEMTHNTLGYAETCFVILVLCILFVCKAKNYRLTYLKLVFTIATVDVVGGMDHHKKVLMMVMLMVVMVRI